MGLDALAGLQYMGEAGISADCLDAVWQLIQTNQPIELVRILSCDRFHGLLIRMSTGGRVAIKAGFASGYGGEGPRTFATVLQLLRRHEIPIEECRVSRVILKRLEASAWTKSDLTRIESADLVRGMRWLDYIDAYNMQDRPASAIWSQFPPILPLAVLDERLVDLALRFFNDDPGEIVFQGFRRLEAALRSRLKCTEIGAKLFASAFEGTESKLRWPGVHSSAAAGRLMLFKGAYAAYRNPRAHAELKTQVSEAVRAFLVLNELFALERAAVER